MFCLSHEDTLIIVSTTGAALFITNFLRTLSRDGLIRFNLSTRRWEYDLQQIFKTVIPPDVRQFLTMQMTKLGHYQCLALKVSMQIHMKLDNLMNHFLLTIQ